MGPSRARKRGYRLELFHSLEELPSPFQALEEPSLLFQALEQPSLLFQALEELPLLFQSLEELSLLVQSLEEPSLLFQSSERQASLFRAGSGMDMAPNIPKSYTRHVNNTLSFYRSSMTHTHCLPVSPIKHQSA